MLLSMHVIWQSSFESDCGTSRETFRLLPLQRSLIITSIESYLRNFLRCNYHCTTLVTRSESVSCESWIRLTYTLRPCHVCREFFDKVTLKCRCHSHKLTLLNTSNNRQWTRIVWQASAASGCDVSREMVLPLTLQTSWTLAWVETQFPKSLKSNRQSLRSGTRSGDLHVKWDVDHVLKILWNYDLLDVRSRQSWAKNQLQRGSLTKLSVSDWHETLTMFIKSCISSNRDHLKTYVKWNDIIMIINSSTSSNHDYLKAHVKWTSRICELKCLSADNKSSVRLGRIDSQKRSIRFFLLNWYHHDHHFVEVK